MQMSMHSLINQHRSRRKERDQTKQTKKKNKSFDEENDLQEIYKNGLS